jgi:hypothetical protein
LATNICATKRAFGAGSKITSRLAAFGRRLGDVAAAPELDEAEIEERNWRQAIDGAGRFLDQWGSLADEFQWTPADLFDVPRDVRLGGLVWFLGGETVRAFGPEHAVTEGERIFDRVTRADWINPYAKG